MARKKATMLNESSDDAIVDMLAAAGGELDRRKIVRKLGHRADLAAALRRLVRRGSIELFARPNVAAPPTNRVRLIGEAALRRGIGYIRVGGRP